MATRPARRPSSTSAGSSPAHSTQVVGRPGGASEPSWCQSLPPTGIAAGSQASHQDSGRVQRRSSQLQCQTSSSGGRRRIGRVQLTGPANGWLTDSSPPAASVASSQASGSSRKSIQPTSPSAPACPPSVVTSWPGSRVIPYRRLAAASSAWWLTVLWSVTARKSSPRPAARAASSETVSSPSECTVCVCRSPASQRRPARAGSTRRGGRSRGTGGAGAGGARVQRRGGRRGLRRQPVAHPVRRDAVHADHHLPGAGLEFPGQVAGRGRVAGDDERLAGAAGPAAEPARAETAQVEHGPVGRGRSRAPPAARPSRAAPPPAGSARGTRTGPPASTARRAVSSPSCHQSTRSGPPKPKFHQLLTYSPERSYRAGHEGHDRQGVPGTGP